MRPIYRKDAFKIWVQFRNAKQFVYSARTIYFEQSVTHIQQIRINITAQCKFTRIQIKNELTTCIVDASNFRASFEEAPRENSAELG